MASKKKRFLILTGLIFSFYTSKSYFFTTFTLSKQKLSWPPEMSQRATIHDKTSLESTE